MKKLVLTPAPVSDRIRGTMCGSRYPRNGSALRGRDCVRVATMEPAEAKGHQAHRTWRVMAKS